MDSKSVKYVAVLLLVFAVVAAAVLNSLFSAAFAGAGY